jgi:DNA-binding NtrC family response regulator
MSEPPGRQYVILLVDDEADILNSFQEFLESSIPGVVVKTASSGKEALPLLKGPLNLVISDYKMPGMDGITFLKHAEEAHPEVPKVLLTAFPKLDLAIEAINEIHVSKFLTKPIPPDKMLAIVRQLLQLPAPAPAPRRGFR